jgi:hypothetical protein
MEVNQSDNLTKRSIELNNKTKLQELAGCGSAR